MTPTEILSYQHYNKFYGICKLLKINIKIITGSSKASIKKDTKMTSRIKITFIDWHTCANMIIQFNNLGIAIIDEQHKFGVAQRSNLVKK